VAAGDRFLPNADLAVTELALVEADANATYAALDGADVSGDRLLGVLGSLTELDRLLAGSGTPPKTLGQLLGPELGFVRLADEPGRLRAVGLAARYSPFDRAVERLEPDAFAGFDRPGYVKAVLGFSLRAQNDGRTLLSCDARVRATDDDTRSTLHAASFMVAPGARLLCRRLVELVRQQAEARLGPEGAEDGDRGRDQRDTGDLSAG
jgi:hypothetical protein